MEKEFEYEGYTGTVNYDKNCDYYTGEVVIDGKIYTYEGDTIEELREDFEGACLGMYFLEFADYYTRENNDETDMLKLLYQSLKAVCRPTLDNRLVKVIYEIKAMVVNGEFPGIPAESDLSDSAKYTIRFIVETPVEKLYTFAVSDSVLSELLGLSEQYRARIIDRKFKSLEIIDTMGVV